MKQYAGIDVSVESASVCVVDATGKIIREVKVASEPAPLIAWFQSLGVAVTRIGLEAGPLSQWLYAAMAEAGLAVELLETRHVRDAFKAMPVKTDRNDARGIAQLMRLGWFRSVHCKSLAAQEVRALLTARRLLQGKRHDVEMSLRGILRGFGLKVGKTTLRLFEARIRDLVDGHPTLAAIAAALLTARATLSRELRGLEKRVREMARGDQRTRLLMTTPGVGTIVALTFVAAVDDPDRFRSSKQVGAHFGLTPRKYQSGETDVTGRISKIGDGAVRTALYEAANIILTRPVKGSALKRWALGGGEARWSAQGEGGFGPQTCLCPTPDAGRRHAVRSRTGALGAARCRGLRREGETEDFRGRRHHAPEATSRRRDDGSGQAATRPADPQRATALP